MQSATVSKNICWRGPAGAGKRHQIHTVLQELAQKRNLTFQVQTKQWALEKLKDTDGPPEEDEKNTPLSKDQFPYETSILHFGFDISRMSLQDRHILPPIFDRLGHGSHVLAGSSEHSESRILVFYHIHLLSIESILSLQSVLEQDTNDIVVWCTSEHPLPLRIAHYFDDIVVGGEDRVRAHLQHSIKLKGGSLDGIYDPQTLFDKAIQLLCNPSPPELHEVAGIRAFLYECLLRNIRWIDCVHHCLISVLRLPLSETHRLAALRVLALQDGSAAGQTIPSYRIPIMWENFFLQLRNVLSGALVGEDANAAATAIAHNARGKNETAAADTHEKSGAVPKRRRLAKKRGVQ